MKHRIFMPAWNKFKRKAAEEGKNLVNTDQLFMEKSHTHGDKIGRITLHPLISILYVIQWCYK